MRKFIAHLTLFFSIALFLILLCWGMLYMTIRDNATFDIDNSTKYVVLGPSHSECSFDDSFIEHLENFSRSGESYCYTYAKLKCILANNKQIDTVFVEFSNPFIYDNDEWLWSNKYLQFHYVTFAPFLSFADHVYLFKKHFFSWCRTTPFFIKDATKKTLKNNYNFSIYGGYLKGDAVLDSTQIQSRLELGNIDVQLYFMDKIVELCHNTGVELIFVRSPLYPKFKYWCTEVQFQQIRNTRYSEVPFWDFGQFLPESKYFRDFHHLNQTGSEKFSKNFNDLLNK